ncbi:hypothetical protein ABZ079_21590 [Streptomyces sp. NPDC006314]|uniref:hypothetical protein n=1 Tax=Streptomyces sp. NPDC006314 TaxID=3154475 RepID=UPI0033A1D853
MRRTARALSVAFVAGAALALAGPAAFADPAADARPGTVPPGGTVAVSVICDAVAGPVPETLDAASPGFEGGTVHLSRVTGNADHETGATGLAYRGTARVTAHYRSVGDMAADRPVGDTAEDRPVVDAAEDRPVGDTADDHPDGVTAEEDPAGTGPDAAWTVDGTCPPATGGTGTPWNAPYSVTRGDDGVPCAEPGPCGTTRACADAEPCGDGGQCRETESCRPGDDGHYQKGEACPDQSPRKEGEPCQGAARECAGADSCTDGGGRCGESHGAPCTDGGGRCGESHGESQAESHGAPCTGGGNKCGESHGAPCPDGQTCRESHGTDGCAQESGQRGVEAGAGGTFNDSVPALVAGGVCIAAACGAAVYRLHLRRRSTAGRPTGM